MATIIDWVTPNKIAEETGVSRSFVIKLLDTGEIKFSKKNKHKQSGLMISVSSFNKFWEKNSVG